jgi:uncharacterized iron-regulated membrane protein
MSLLNTLISFAVFVLSFTGTLLWLQQRRRQQKRLLDWQHSELERIRWMHDPRYEENDLSDE